MISPAMENEQDLSQPKSLTKSYRKRQRRKEAAALQKQAFRSGLIKADSSVQSQECQSETDNKVLKESITPGEILKNTSDLSISQLSSQVIETKKLKNLPNNLHKDQKISNVKPEEKITDLDKTSTTSHSKRRRNRKKALQPETVDEAQEGNSKIKDSQPCIDVPKSGVEFTLHNLCSWEDYISGKDNLIPSNTFTCRDNDNLVPTDKKYSETSALVEKIGNTTSESSEKIRKRKEEETNKSLKDTAISLDLGVVMSESDKVVGSLNRNKNVQVNEDLDKTSVACILDHKEDSLTDKTNSGLTSKTEKKEGISKVSNNTVDFREEHSQSSYLFQQTGIYSSHITSKTNNKGDIKASLATSNNTKEAVIVETIGCEMNKSVEKIDKGVADKEPVDKNESPNTKTVVKKTTNKPEMGMTPAAEEGGENNLEKSRNQVKAEREARKAAKMAKKQKEAKPTSDIKEAAEVDVPPPVKDIKEVKNVQGLTPAKSNLTGPIQSNESNTSTKSKAELRAERRAKQEAQRAAKTASATSTKPVPAKANTSNSSHVPKAPSAHVNKIAEVKYPVTKVKAVRREQGAKLLSRLGWEESRLQKRKESTLADTQSVHPAIVQLGTKFTNRIISGSNARCLAYVQALKKAIQDYQTPPQKELGRDMESRLLAQSLAYLEAQRPHAVSVTNATRFLKWQLTQLQEHCSSDQHLPSTPSPDTKNLLSDQQEKLKLIKGLDSYIWEKIELAEKAVCITLKDKIKDGDVILTYGCSYLLQQILIGAKKAGTKFKVVVVDGRPWREGREMLRCLVGVGIPCSYVLLSAASSIMRQVNKVLLGAHALLSNGYVMSRVGVSQVALLASAHNVPVLVACETHKFCERVQSDSFVYNEMGEPDGLAQLLGGEEGPLSGWRNIPCLSLLNLSYDVTPPELVTAVATELAVLPCTSVPVVLRVRPTKPVNSRH